ncbi:MAG: DUF3793 family protein [Treponema sp.]|nr:DUF3793 family protein [Treponema sp.]
MSFEQMIVYFGAPALCGLKSANLLSVKSNQFSSEKIIELNGKLASLGKRIVAVSRSSANVLLFIYDKSLLYKALCGKAQMLYLMRKSYPVSKGLDAIVKELLFRMSWQMRFPHEVGLFLGYPLEDVVLFEKDGGRSSKFSGMWQVYGNVEEARRKMMQYRQCSLACSHYFDMGMEFSHITKHYKEISKKISGMEER